MPEYINFYEYSIAIERCREGWCACIWRSSFNDTGVIDGVVKHGSISSRSRFIVRRRAKALAREARRKGARWPRLPDNVR